MKEKVKPTRGRPKIPVSDRRISVTVRVLPTTRKHLKRLFKPHGGLGRYLDKVAKNGRVPHV